MQHTVWKPQQEMSVLKYTALAITPGWMACKSNARLRVQADPDLPLMDLQPVSVTAITL